MASKKAILWTITATIVVIIFVIIWLYVLNLAFNQYGQFNPFTFFLPGLIPILTIVGLLIFLIIERHRGNFANLIEKERNLSRFLFMLTVLISYILSGIPLMFSVITIFYWSIAFPIFIPVLVGINLVFRRRIDNIKRIEKEPFAKPKSSKKIIQILVIIETIVLDIYFLIMLMGIDGLQNSLFYYITECTFTSIPFPILFLALIEYIYRNFYPLEGKAAPLTTPKDFRLKGVIQILILITDFIISFIISLFLTMRWFNMLQFGFFYGIVVYSLFISIPLLIIVEVAYRVWKRTMEKKGFQKIKSNNKRIIQLITAGLYFLSVFFVSMTNTFPAFPFFYFRDLLIFSPILIGLFAMNEVFYRYYMNYDAKEFLNRISLKLLIQTIVSILAIVLNICNVIDLFFGAYLGFAILVLFPFILVFSLIILAIIEVIFRYKGEVITKKFNQWLLSRIRKPMISVSETPSPEPLVADQIAPLSEELIDPNDDAILIANDIKESPEQPIIVEKIEKIQEVPDQKIELKRGIDFMAGYIRYKVALKNLSQLAILNVELSLRMPAEHIRVIDIKPGIYRMGSRAKIPHMVAEQSESIDFYLEPLICGNIPVTPIAIYLDAYGDTYMAKGNPLSVVSKCPLILNPGEENIAKVKNLLESQEYITSYRTVELEYDAKKSFELLRESIGAWAGKPVSKPIYVSEKPFKAETYFYVLNQNPDEDLGHREEIIVKLNINEENKVAILTAGAEKNTTVNGVLTHIWHLANTRFGEQFGFDLKGLNCPECGAGFEEVDKDSNTVKCKYCGEVFQKKAIK